MTGSHLEKKFWQLVRAAERQFGVRDERFSFKGFKQDIHGPQIEFDQDGGTGIFIQLNYASAEQAAFQIAHEVIHFLGPENDPPRTLITEQGKYPPALMIEEGLAVSFSLSTELVASAYRERCKEWIRGEARYFEALQIYREIEAMMPGSILKVRKEFPRLCKLTGPDLERLIPGLSRELAEKACSRNKMR